MHLVKGAARFAFICMLAFAFSSQLALAQHAAKDNPSGDGQTVAKDNNGALRKPTAEEAAELTKGAKPRTPLSELKKTETPSGAVGYTTDESYETSIVATRSADGKLKIACDDQHKTLKPVKAKKAKKSAAPTSEVPRAEAQ
jgi:hypothetical protein